VIRLPHSSLARISLAIALSLSVHLALLSTPLLTLPPAQPTLPPLIARLEPLPHAPPVVATKNKTPPFPAPKKTVRKVVKPALKPAPKVVAAPPEPIATASTVDDTPAPTPLTEESVPSNLTGENAAVPAETTASQTEAVTDESAEVPIHPLPKHAALRYAVFKGTDLKIGEARHLLDVDSDNHYTLTVNVNTTGVVSLLKKFNLTQISSGRYSKKGLAPNQFSETKETAAGTENQLAEFAWAEHSLKFSAGNSVSLPAHSQDFVSFLYQLSQLTLDQDSLSMSISNGKKLERYELAIGEEQEIDTRMGKMRAIPFRKIHAPHEEGLEVWLGIAYRLLPVKISQIDRDGSVLGEMVIAEIRLSDE
jgi:Protein of unknown function (DUF3108)